MAKAFKVHKALDSFVEQRGSCPPSPYEVGGDEAIISLATSIKHVIGEKDALPSWEDDLSLDETPCGDEHKVLDELPIDSQILQWCTLD